jgi:general secretion pathway protein H
MRSRQNGFTLIELLAVLVVLAVVMGAAATRIGFGRGGDTLQATAYEIASRCRAARAAAIRHGSDRTVAIDLANRSVHVDGGRPVSIPGTIAIRADTSAGEQLSASVAGIRFHPNGSSSGGMLTLEAGNRAYAVRVNWFTGRVIVERTL